MVGRGNKHAMDDYNINDFTFDALCLHDKGPEINTLAYLIGLVDSEKHVAGDPFKARRILYQLSEAEEQIEDAGDLLGWQAEVLPKNYFPQTPMMLVQRWSPIVAMIEKGFKPESLARIDKPACRVSGIWKPATYTGSKKISDCQTDEELFWVIMNEVFKRATDRGLLVNIIAEIGWGYERGIGSLTVWDAKEISKADRVIWKRTVKG